MTRLGMAIDLNRCFGCHTCMTACKIANNLPKGLKYNTVHTVGGDSDDTAAGEFPNCTMSWMPVGCQHCENPACFGVCPTGATAINDDGVVTVDPDVCIGCGSCVAACPYEVRTLIEEEPEFYVEMAVGEADAPKHIAGVVEKCTFCTNLLGRGEVPACMQLCPGRARFWGDLDDPESEVSKAIEGREYELYLEEAGTRPKVYYLK